MDDIQLSIEEQGEIFCNWYYAKYGVKMTPNEVWMKLRNLSGQPRKKLINLLEEYSQDKLKQVLLNIDLLT